jgi:hypothetical protein
LAAITWSHQRSSAASSAHDEEAALLGHRLDICRCPVRFAQRPEQLIGRVGADPPILLEPGDLRHLARVDPQLVRLHPALIGRLAPFCRM